MSSNRPVDPTANSATPAVATSMNRRQFIAGMGLAALPLGLPARAQGADSPTEAIRRLVAERKIANAHEHIQGRDNQDELLREMDALGIGRTVLLGSPWFTIALYEQAGFTRYDENNAAVTAMAREHPERLLAWPTVNPLDPDKVVKIRDLVDQGATGVKLYLGHGYTSRRGNAYIFHPMAMDDSRMMELYEYLAENHLPVCFHVNPAKPGFMDEFVTVLKRFPDLKVNTPHFMLSSMAHSRLREMFRTFPNLLVDISFGHDDYLKTGLERISYRTEAFQSLIGDYPNRFIFGTDYVVTSLRPHDHAWFATRTQAYLDLLSRSTYTTALLPGKDLNGLALSAELIEKILYQNFDAFLAAKPTGTTLTHELRWEELRVRPVERAPGQALPPPPQRGWRRRG